jgi:hypothetical protein
MYHYFDIRDPSGILQEEKAPKNATGNNLLSTRELSVGALVAA